MKKAFLLFLSCAALHMVTALAEEQEWSLREQILGVKAKFTVRVVDENGKPVEGAKVWARFSRYSQGKFTIVEKLTDQDGRAEVGGRCDFYTRFVITKDGYYETSHTIEYDEDGYERKGGKWQPYGGMVQYILKKIYNPIPMKRINNFRFPVPKAEQEYGFDMECGALVEPYGPGKIADFYVKYSFPEAEGIFWKIMTISFPNSLDGGYLIDLNADSSFKGPYHAKLDANYSKEFTLKYALEFEWKKDSSSGRMYKSLVGITPLTDERIAKNQGLVIRTRTKSDTEGNLVSAHYGIIYGEICLGEGKLQGTECGPYASLFFNPGENDTNLEFDNQWHRELRKQGGLVPEGGLFSW